MTPQIEVPGPPRDFIGYGPNPPKVRWPDDAALAVSIVVNYEEGSERSKAFGDEHNEGMTEVAYILPDQYRDLGAESMYEYGSRAGIWRLLHLFDEYGVKVTMYAAAVALEQNPAVGEWIRRAGHEPCSHGWRWEEIWLLDREEERRRIQMTIDSLTRTCGRRPVGCYHRYAPSVHTRELLVESCGKLAASRLRDEAFPRFEIVIIRKRGFLVELMNHFRDIRSPGQRGGLGHEQFRNSVFERITGAGYWVRERLSSSDQWLSRNRIGPWIQSRGNRLVARGRLHPQVLFGL